MSSISIGFVFEKQQNVTETFSELLISLTTNGKMKKLAYSLDKDGDNWEEETTFDYSINRISSIMIDNYFGRITIESVILTNKSITYDVSISNLANDDFGFLIEIDIEHLFKVGNKDELESCTKEVIQFCEKIFDRIEYKYSFCDHEAALEYTWDEFKAMNENIYSVSIIPKDNIFIVNLTTWEIDGLSSRGK